GHGNVAFVLHRIGFRQHGRRPGPSSAPATCVARPLRGAQRLGVEVAQLLVDPGTATKKSLARVARSVATRSEGAFIPIVARPGTGCYPRRHCPSLPSPTTPNASGKRSS